MNDNGTRTCLRANNMEKCEGEVTARESFGGTGTRIHECVKHMAASRARNNEHRKNYPDSDTPPAWHDPSFAGERWNEDY